MPLPLQTSPQQFSSCMQFPQLLVLPTSCSFTGPYNVLKNFQHQGFSKYISMLNEVPCLEDEWGNWDIAPGILNLSSKWRWVVSFTPLSLYRWVRALGNHWTWDWVRSKASSILWRGQKYLALDMNQTSIPQPTSAWPNAILIHYTLIHLVYIKV